MSDNVNLSKKIVTYEAMSKYDECLKQFINNKLANFDGSSSGSSNTNNALPIGNLDDGIHTWENLMTAVYEKSFGGPIQIHNPNWMSGDGERQYIIYSGTYLGVCDGDEYHYNIGGTLGPESATGYNVNTFNLPTTTTTTSSSTTTTTTTTTTPAATEPSTTTTTTSSSTTTPELESTTTTSEIYHGPNLVLMIGNVLTFELNDANSWHQTNLNDIHTTDYHIVGLSIENDNDAGYNDLNYYNINVLFDIPIVSLSKLSMLESKITTLQNQLNNVGEIPEYTINYAESIDVDPNTLVVANLEDPEFSNYCEIRLVPPTKPGYVYEYRIILKDEYGGYRDIYFDIPWGGTLNWANGDAPDFANEYNSSATYEINIKLHIDPNYIEYDDSDNTISSCLCNLWGTYTKYSWS